MELTLGHPEQVEQILREALFDEEKIAGTLGSATISRAEDDRPLYAVLAGVWQAQGRSGEDILALWERYRMRILGISVPICPDKEFTCDKPILIKALERISSLVKWFSTTGFCTIVRARAASHGHRPQLQAAMYWQPSNRLNAPSPRRLLLSLKLIGPRRRQDRSSLVRWMPLDL